MQNGFLCEQSPLFIAGAPATVGACAAMIRRWLEGGKPLSPGCAEEIRRSNLRDMANVGAGILSSDQIVL